MLLHFVLRHRLRKDPLESIDSGDKVQTVFEEVFKYKNAIKRFLLY